MSFRLMQRVWDIDLPPAKKLLLLRLAFYGADDGREVYPSVEILATACNLSRRGVQKILRQFEECGILDLQGSAKGGRGRTRKYNIALERANRVRCLKGEPGSLFPSKGRTRVHKRANQGALKGEPGSPNLLRPVKELTDSVAAPSFDDFWRTFPSRRPHPNPKRPARLKFDAAVKRGVPAADIIRGAVNFAKYVARERTEPKFIVQAVTWLSQERWTEYQAEPEPANPTAVGWL